jgi:hypothetical protein
MLDFSLITYITLLEKMKRQGFSFQTVNDFIKKAEDKIVVLRQDIDTSKANSLQFAKIQHSMDIIGSYYFRIVPQSFDDKIILEIAKLGHEIGYHYESIDTVYKKIKDKSKKTKVTNYDFLIDAAYEEFCLNLERFQKLVPITTICMHGSPMSKFDNRLIWKKYDYKKLGIIAEPYFDVDFHDILYLTDTGRRWDGAGINIRDKASEIKHDILREENYKEWQVKPMRGSLMNMTHESIDFQKKHKFSSTSKIIQAAEIGNLPDKMMMTFHPQRWTDKSLPWAKELVWQNVKNVGKYFLIKWRK